MAKRKKAKAKELENAVAESEAAVAVVEEPVAEMPAVEEPVAEIPAVDEPVAETWIPLDMNVPVPEKDKFPIRVRATLGKSWKGFSGFLRQHYEFKNGICEITLQDEAMWFGLQRLGLIVQEISVETLIASA